MHKHILIATDGSEPSSKAVTYGIALAKEHKALVTVITATEPWSAFNLALETGIGIPEPLRQYESEAAEAAKAILDKAAQLGALHGVACNLIHVPDQHPAEAIIETAKKNGCDLIVMASHGRRGVDRLLIGSRTSEVLTQSKVPVLVVR